MPFPSLLSLLAYHHVFLISGPLALAVGFFLLRVMRSRRGQRPPFTLLLGPPIALFVGLFHIWNTGVQLNNARQFRSLAPDQILAMEIEPMERSGSNDLGGQGQNLTDPTGIALPMVRIDDPSLIQTAFETLKTASAISRSTSPLVSGFRIKLQLRPDTNKSAEREFYLSVYDHRADGGPNDPVQIVVPHLSKDITPSTHGGYFSSPEFMDWIKIHAK